MKIIKLSFCIISLFTVFSFANLENIEVPTGEFISRDNFENSLVALRLNTDNSFVYKDVSNPDKKINVEGRWTVKGNSILLTASNSEIKFHDKWKVDKNNQCIKSRLGLAYYRVCK